MSIDTVGWPLSAWEVHSLGFFFVICVFLFAFWSFDIISLYIILYHFYISNISLQRSKEIRRFSTTKTICRDESTILIWKEIWWFAPAFNGYNSWIFIARIHRLSWNSFVSDSMADDWTTSATQRLLDTKTSVKENDSRTPEVFEGITSKNCFGCLKITTFFALFLVGISVRGIWIPHQTPLDDPDLPQKGHNSSRKRNHWPIKVYANCCYRQ